MLRLVGDADFDHVVSEMNEAITEVETGEVTVATRTVEINGVDVKSGEVIALLNGKLVNASPTLEEAVNGLLESAGTDDRERITIFYGANIAKNDVNRIADDIRNKYPNHELEVHEGAQPHYQFIFMIE